MGQFSHLIGGASWSILGKLVQFLLGLVTIAIIARSIGPAAYGAFALGWVIIGLMDVLVSWAPSDTLVQRHQATRGHFNASLLGAMLIAVVAAGLIAWHAGTLATLLNGGALLAMILPVRALLLPIKALSVGPLATLTRASRFTTIAALYSVSALVSNALAIVLVLAGAGVWSLVAMELVNALVIALIAWRVSGWSPGWRCSLADGRDLLAFNASTWASWGFAYAESQLPRLFIGTMIGAQAAGYFSLAQRLFEQIAQVVMLPVYQVVQAGTARAQTDKAAVAGLASGAIRLLTLIACPLFLGLSAVSVLVVPAVFGPDWLGAVVVVQVLMFGGIRSSLAMVQLAVIRGLGKPHWEAFSAFAGLSLTAVLLLIAVPYGPAAAALAVVVSGYLVWPMEARFVSRLCGLRGSEQAAAGARTTLSAVVMALTVWAALPVFSDWFGAGLQADVATVFTLLAAAILALLVYVLMLAWLLPDVVRVLRTVVRAVLRKDMAAAKATITALGV